MFGREGIRGGFKMLKAARADVKDVLDGMYCNTMANLELFLVGCGLVGWPAGSRLRFLLHANRGEGHVVTCRGTLSQTLFVMMVNIGRNHFVSSLLNVQLV